LKFLSNRIYRDENGEYRLRNCPKAKVESVLACLDAGNNEDQICANYPGINENDIKACKVWATLVMEERYEYKRNKGMKKSRTGTEHPPVKFMFDENLSWKIIPEVLNRISEVSQIHLEDMAGAKDIEIWERFKTNGSRSVIVTRDDDFITLSQVFAMNTILTHKRMDNLDDEIKQYPYVVHVSGKGRGKNASSGSGLSSSEIAKAFNKYSVGFTKAAMRPRQQNVFCSLNKCGLRAGDSLPQVFERYLTTDYNVRQFFDLDDIAVENLDIDALNMELCINWQKLNKDRKHVGLKAVHAATYEGDKLELNPNL
tara:strand:+ start:1860 stop:2798 length:939 start_codon:yes stop_codon:yes gene_type:complete